MITTKQKNIGNLLLKKVELEFTDEIIDLISLLKIIDIGFGMRGGDFITYKNVTDFLTQTYTDENFKKSNSGN